MDESQQSLYDHLPDRPIECTECKKQICCLYTEMWNQTITKTSMCRDCPELQKRLKGTASNEREDTTESGTGLACGNCRTTLASLKVGGSLGCSDCYEVFGDIIIEEMLKEGSLSERSKIKKGAKSYHSGRQPGEAQELKPSLRLLALNEALKETLAHEDYEQAAWLRDQIKELTDDSEGKSNEKK